MLQQLLSLAHPNASVKKPLSKIITPRNPMTRLKKLGMIGI
jgi:hypothetical protein